MATNSSLFVFKGDRKWVSDALNDAIQLANDIFWTSRSKIIMLNYNVESSTIDSIVSEFSGPLKKSSELRNMTPAPSNLGIPQIQVNVDDLPDENGCKVFARFRPSSPENLILSSSVANACKNACVKKKEERKSDYNRVVLFTAIVS